MATAKKFSRKREAILTCLHGTTCHPTAEWVYQQLKPEEQTDNAPLGGAGTSARASVPQA